MHYNYKKLIGFFIPVLFALAAIIYVTKSFTTLGTVSFLFSLSFGVIFSVLIFAKQQVFQVWLKFSVIFLPIAAVLVSLMAQGSRGSLVSIDEELGSLFFAIIFLVVSLLIIAIKSFKLRGEGK